MTAFLPTERKIKMVKGKRKIVEVSLVPNIFFAYGTLEQLKTYVYDNVNLPFLRFYYRYSHPSSLREKTPLTVPDSQMDTFRIICESHESNVIISPREIPRFQRGEMARVTEGRFTGVIGRVVRYKAQQRVGIIIDGLMTVATAYIPDAFLEKIEIKSK